MGYALLLLVFAADPLSVRSREAAHIDLALLGPGPIALQDGTTLDLAWVQRILRGYYQTPVFGHRHDNGHPRAMFDQHGTVARWYDRDARLWAHVEYEKRSLSGDCLHASPDGKTVYAAQFRAWKRNGWQVFTDGAFAVATEYEEDEPIITVQVRGGKVVETWYHISDAPNEGLRAYYEEAEASHRRFRKELARMRSTILGWIASDRRARAAALAPAKRQEALDEKRRQDRAKDAFHQWHRSQGLRRW
jgi:hypothetical protein